MKGFVSIMLLLSMAIGALFLTDPMIDHGATGSIHFAEKINQAYCAVTTKSNNLMLIRNPNQTISK